MNVTVSANTDDTRRLLRKSPAAAARALDGTLNDASALYLRELRTDPGPKSGSRYKRTKTLSRSWDREFSGSGLARRVLIGSNRNMAPYNRIVQDDVLQARMHRQVWGDKTVQSVNRNNQRRVGEFLQRRVDLEFAKL